jgi:acyl carrier protein
MTGACHSCYFAAMATLEQQIKEKLVASLGLKIAPDAITDEMPLFVNGLGLDSVDALEIAAMLSAHFNAEITEQDTGRYREILANVSTLAKFVRECQAAKA